MSERYVAGIFCENETITQIDRKIDNVQADEVVDATGKYVFPRNGASGPSDMHGG